MTRKRSKYRPKGVIFDVMSYVKAGVAKVTCHTDANVVLRIRNQSSLNALADGTATSADLDALISLCNVTTALKRLGKGEDWASEIRAGVAATEAVQQRYTRWGKLQATPTELEVMTLLLGIHEAQLDDSAVVHVERALAIAKRGVLNLPV